MTERYKELIEAVPLVVTATVHARPMVDVACLADDAAETLTLAVSPVFFNRPERDLKEVDRRA